MTIPRFHHATRQPTRHTSAGIIVPKRMNFAKLVDDHKILSKMIRGAENKTRAERTRGRQMVYPFRTVPTGGFARGVTYNFPMFRMMSLDAMIELKFIITRNR